MLVVVYFMDGTVLGRHLGAKTELFSTRIATTRSTSFSNPCVGLFGATIRFFDADWRWLGLSAKTQRTQRDGTISIKRERTVVVLA